MLNVLIFGSCVSRDIFNFDTTNRLRLVDYYARSSFASAFCPLTREESLSHLIASPFQRRIVKADLDRSFREQLACLDFDVLLIDLIDERFDLFVTDDGHVITLSNELLSTGFAPGAERGAVIRSGSEAFFDLWQAGWKSFVDTLDRHGQRGKVKINQVFWSTETSSKGTFFPGYSARGIAEANRFLSRLYEYTRCDLQTGQYLALPASCFIGCESHRWGISPFHYVDSYYEMALAELTSIALSKPAAGEGATNEVSQPSVVAQPDVPTVTEEPSDDRGLQRDTAGTSAYQEPEVTSEASVDASTEPEAQNFSPTSRCEPKKMISTTLRKRTLSKFPVYVTHEVAGRSTLHFTVELLCAQGVGERQALLMFDFGRSCEADVSRLGLTRSADPRVGLYRYVDTRPGRVTTEFSLDIPSDCRALLVGVRTWFAAGDVRLESLSISPGVAQKKAAFTLLSVDVEALPGRADCDYVDKLIYGVFDGKQYGIERLCDIFADYDVQATFFVDYATCCLHGDQGIFRASEFLSKRGHDVQLHLHSEVLVRRFDWEHDKKNFPGFEYLGYPTTLQVMEYGVQKFRENLGYTPRIFRPGGMKKGLNTYLACKSLGLEAVSAVFKDYDPTHWQSIGHEGIYRWENDLLEIPLDIPLDPLVRWPPFPGTVTRLFETKKRKILSLLLHSTSLLYRERTHDAKFLRYEVEYERTLRSYLDFLRPICRFATHSEILDSSATEKEPALPQVSFASAGFHPTAAALSE